MSLTGRNVVPVKEEPVKEKKVALFDFVNAIHSSKIDLMADEENEKKYNAYMVNRALSFGADTVFLANVMNALPQLDKRVQFTFLLKTVRPMKRYNAWVKAETSEELEAVKQYYGYSTDKAAIALKVLTKEQLGGLKAQLSRGGTKG